MKPQPCPENVDWQSWPTILQLQQETNGVPLSRVRAALTEVQCYRCTDKSVRYEPEAARARVYELDEDDELEDGFPAKGPPTSDQIVVVLSKMITELRRDRSDVIKVMQGPLESGLKLQDKLISTLIERLSHLEALWDRMVNVTEEMMSTKEARDLKRKQAEQSEQWRERTWAFAQKHLPKFLEKWELTTEAGMAVDLIASMPAQLLEVVIAADVLTPDQKQKLEVLIERLRKKKPPEKPASANDANHAAA